MTTPQSQQDYLQVVKAELKLAWDELARRAQIAPLALKSYRLPADSNGFRQMPELAWRALEALRALGPDPPPPDQRELLRAAKAELGVTWQELADLTGINSLTLRNYLKSETDSGHRQMPPLARSAIERALSDKPAKKSPKKA